MRIWTFSWTVWRNSAKWRFWQFFCGYLASFFRTSCFTLRKREGHRVEIWIVVWAIGWEEIKPFVCCSATLRPMYLLAGSAHLTGKKKQEEEVANLLLVRYSYVYSFSKLFSSTFTIAVCLHGGRGKTEQRVISISMVPQAAFRVV